MCRQPYDDKRFMIGSARASSHFTQRVVPLALVRRCDRCVDYFHPTCVGLGSITGSSPGTCFGGQCQPGGECALSSEAGSRDGLRVPKMRPCKAAACATATTANADTCGTADAGTADAYIPYTDPHADAASAAATAATAGRGACVDHGGCLAAVPRSCADGRPKRGRTCLSATAKRCPIV